MKWYLLLLVSLLVNTLSYAQVNVKGYFRSNGTYVESHLRTYPNNTITDNYSYPGNYNPNKGTITGGSVAYTRSKIDDYSFNRPSVDWIESMERDLSEKRKKYSANPPPTFKNDLPKYVPITKKNYFKNNNGRVVGYTYTSGEMLIYQTFFVYNPKGVFMFFVIKYEDGVMYAYDPNGQFIMKLNVD